MSIDKTREWGWRPGGVTKGGAREWVVDSKIPGQRGLLGNFTIRELEK